VKINTPIVVPMMMTAVLSAAIAGPAFGAVTWYVDVNNPSCSNAGPGTSVTPFCSISAGASHALAGDTVSVNPGTYREQVTVPASGASGAPITYAAASSGVVVLGTLDVSDPAGWAATGSNAWSRSYAPPSSPTQVFKDGARLAKAASAATTTTDSFFFDTVAKVLYVDIGGANPGMGHMIEAGARTYGFQLTSRSEIVIDGFEIQAPNGDGVRLTTSSGVVVRNATVTSTGGYGILADTCTAPLTVADNVVSLSGSVGIRLLNSTGVTVSGNISHHNDNSGVALQGSGGNQIVGNVLFANDRPDTRGANGVDVNGASSDNLIEANLAYANDDSGFQAYNGSNRNVFVRNVSWNNGDHGFDTNNATDTRYISNTSYGNFDNGINIEGGAINAVLSDNISANNGLTTGKFDLRVDPSATPGFVSDYDILWDSAAVPTIQFNGANYIDLVAFANATGNEAHGIAADPMFVDPAQGDLHLQFGSPAVDAADASVTGFVLADRDGHLPVDVPSVPNTGVGDPSYADRGAYELIETGPTAQLSVTPTSGTAPLKVTADASGSTDAMPIATYTFDFGDGTVVGPQAGATATHTYTLVGPHTVVVTVTDMAGISATATADVTVNDAPPNAKLSVNSRSKLFPSRVTADASASTDPDSTPIATFTFDFGDGTIVGPQASPIAIHNYSPGHYRVTVTVTDTAGLSDTAWKQVNIRR
jgi:parallel beta-helix repeat protein